MRYAPTLDHVQALFRGLHLGPEETNGVTSFGPVQPSLSIGRCLPSLVILIGCFSKDDSTTAATFSSANTSTTTVADDREQGSQDPSRAMTAVASKTLSEIKDALDWITQTS